jgi:hypothetical protein
VENAALGVVVFLAFLVVLRVAKHVRRRDVAWALIASGALVQAFVVHRVIDERAYQARYTAYPLRSWLPDWCSVTFVGHTEHGREEGWSGIIVWLALAEGAVLTLALHNRSERPSHGTTLGDYVSCTQCGFESHKSYPSCQKCGAPLPPSRRTTG